MSKQDTIAQDLLTKINSNLYPPGSFLPSENTLITIYKSSRETIRRALNKLESLGLIQKIRGKGSIVLNEAKFDFPISGITSFQELNQQFHMNATTKVVFFHQLKKIPDNFKQYFPDVTDKPGYYVERLRCIDNKPIVLDCDYLFNPPIINLTKAEAQNSLYAYIENKLHYTIAYGTKEITIVDLPEQFQKIFPLKNNLAVLVASQNYLSNATKFQLTLSYHEPSQFKFTDFARRQKLIIGR